MQNTMDIRVMQLALTTLGFRCQLSGVLDEGTAKALMAFQRNYRLEQTGVADGETIDAIQRLRHAWLGKDFLV